MRIDLDELWDDDLEDSEVEDLELEEWDDWGDPENEEEDDLDFDLL